MNTLQSIAPRAQFSLLSQFVGTPEQPYTPVPSSVLQFAIMKMQVAEPSVGFATPNDLVEAEHYAINLKGDPRVRWTKSSDKSTGNEPRQSRPWLQAHPVGNIGAIVRLTSEGRRRLFALNDMFAQPGPGPLPPIA